MNWMWSFIFKQVLGWATEEIQTNSNRIKIGIVGGGFGATFQWHLHPRCEVAAICDLRDDRLAVLEKTYRCSNRYKQFRELLKHPGLDAVGVFTPAPLHVFMAVEAMRAGKHVISAVPAGLHEEELAQLLDCVKTTGRRYMMAETSFDRAWASVPNTRPSAT
jgi:predicted dehydrogenase